ncbi:hypothetical protein H8958_009794 [Nasalis larvatus]
MTAKNPEGTFWKDSMNFTTHSTTSSTNYWSLGSIQLPSYVAQLIDNAHIAADDFRVKYETELAMCQSVESDIHGLCKTIDDTNVAQLQLEAEIEALKEELLFMKKIHKEEVKDLPAQIASSGLTVEVDALKSQDLAEIMADIQA